MTFTQKLARKHKQTAFGQFLMRRWIPNCPSLYELYSTPPTEHQLIKAIICFPIGAVLGIAFHYAVISRLRIPHTGQLVISGIFLGSVAIGFAVSAPARCVVLLVLPTFCGKAGRSYIGTFALIYLLSGPVANILRNASEVTRSVRCSMEVAANLTKSRSRLRLTPVGNIMKDLMKRSDSIQEVAQSVKKQFIPVVTEVEDDKEIEKLKADNDYVDSLQQKGKTRSQMIEERYNQAQVDTKGGKKAVNYERKLDYRCEDVFSIGVKSCYKVFADVHARCMQKLSIIGHLLCLPLKLSIVCNLIKLIPGIIGLNCEAMESINEGFGDAYQTALDSSKELSTNFKVNMQYKVVKADEEVDMVTPEEVSRGVAYEFESRIVYVNFILDMINTCTTFLFIRVLNSSYKYHKKYISDFRHDNIYITDYFRHVDARRRRQRKRTLMPFKKVEGKKVIFPLSRSLTKGEIKKVISRSIRMFLEVFTYIMVILVDRLLYECMDIIQRHSRIEYKQVGSHKVSLKVHGKGVMGHLVRALLLGFNVKHKIHDLASNEPCLPIPSKVPADSLMKIALVFSAMWLLILMDAYMMRLRRLTASFFYPKREKKRTLFLYNDMLKKRKGFLRHTRHAVRRRARVRQLQVKTSMLVSLTRQYPRIFGPLRRFSASRPSCLVCEEKETKKTRFIRCQTRGCRFVYCRECWIDVKRKCYACRGAHEWSSESN